MQESVWIHLQYTEHVGELFELGRKASRRLQIRIAQTIDLASHLEQYRAGFGRVEVVIHCLAKASREGIATLRRCLRQASEGGVKPLQGALGFLQTVFGVIDRAAIVA